ncbi:MAG TPA: argininosuccinate lyase [Bryobacteraceae bacterium]|nr:argininosuccinate lyase [Bryobacteraceae bacterium]
MTPEQFPAPVYAATVLTQNFEDAKRYFLDSLIEIHYAHTRMLAAQGIISAEEERTLISALNGLDRGLIAQAVYDGSYEDLFFFIESLLEKSAGEVAGKMHTARSRNDIAITLYRMTARRELLKLATAVAELRCVLLDLASRNLETVMPAHTHTQPAQPTTLAHYLLGATEFLARDAERIESAFAHVNLSPLGAAALTTTGFPIDRHRTEKFLGFEGLAENSYAAIAAIDYLTESGATVAVAMVNLGKLIQDLLLWSTREFGFLRLSDAYVQSSSIMPQKRNPVALEHARILSSRALGEAQAVLTCAHNTPFGDINDSEDDLQPLIFTMFTDAGRALKLLAGTMRTVTVDRAELARRAGKDFLTVTELADTLVRREGMSFREAHHLVAQTVQSSGRDDDPAAIAATLLSLRPGLRLTRAQIETALDPENFIRIRNIEGGPAPERTSEAIARARSSQQKIEQWIDAKTALLDRAHAELHGTAVHQHPSRTI